MLNGESFLSQIRNKKRTALFTTLIRVPKVLARAIRQEEEIKSINWRERKPVTTCR